MTVALRPWRIVLALGSVLTACDSEVCVRNSDCRGELMCVEASCVEPLEAVDTDAVADGSSGLSDDAAVPPAPEDPIEPDADTSSTDGGSTDGGSTGDSDERGPVRRAELDPDRGDAPQYTPGSMRQGTSRR